MSHDEEAMSGAKLLGRFFLWGQPQRWYKIVAKANSSAEAGVKAKKIDGIVALQYGKWVVGILCQPMRGDKAVWMSD
jgi:hypothetical protein